MNYPTAINARIAARHASIAQRGQLANRSGFGFLYVLCVPLAAGMATARGASIGGYNYTGWMWIFFLASGLISILAVKALDRQARVAFPFAPWCVWYGFLGLSLVWCRDLGPRNVQDFLQISMPLVIAMAASMFIETEAQLKILLRMFAVTLGLLSFSMLIGRLGLLGDLDMENATRPMGLTAALIGCVFIAGCPERLLKPLLLWGVCILFATLTAGRMATMVVLLLPILHPQFRGWRWRLMVLLVMAVVGTALFYTPVFQKQFFHAGSGTLTDLFQGQIRGSGRFEAWPLILEEAMKAPILGHGVGTTYEFVPTVWVRMNHVHNDYLRIGFEVGVVGLVLFLCVVIWQLVELKRQIARTTGLVQHAFVAGFLGFCVFLITSTTGNTLVNNLWFMNPLMALVGAAYGASRFAARSSPLATADGLQPSGPQSPQDISGNN